MIINHFNLKLEAISISVLIYSICKHPVNRMRFDFLAAQCNNISRCKTVWCLCNNFYCIAFL